jgi:hypothetical protein
VGATATIGIVGLESTHIWPRGHEHKLRRVADAQGRVPLILDLPGLAWFDVAMMPKVILLARKTAAELEITLPGGRVLDETLATTDRLGYTHRALTAMYEFLATSSAGTRRPSLRASQRDRREN